MIIPFMQTKCTYVTETPEYTGREFGKGTVSQKRFNGGIVHIKIKKKGTFDSQLARQELLLLTWKGLDVLVLHV